MTTSVPLQPGLVALIDDLDAARVLAYEWVAWTNGGSNIYVRRRGWGKDPATRVYLHRFVLGAPAGMPVDHVNGNGLDNRRCNLRLATPSQNVGNQFKRRGTSRFKGVYWHVARGNWLAQMRNPPQNQYLGSFDSEDDAARAYDAAAVAKWGEFSRPNFPNEYKETAWQA